MSPLSLIQKLLQIGLADPPDKISNAFDAEKVLLPGPVYLRIIARIQAQAKEGGHPRAEKVHRALTAGQFFIGTALGTNAACTRRGTEIFVNSVN